MLPKLNRLKNREDFSRVRKNGKVVQGDSIGIATLPTSKDNESRFGFVISKKISKNAVTRNRLKRVYREIIRNNIKDISKGYDVVFLVKKTALGKTKNEISKDVENILKKTNLL